jgi:hypothetical protein
MGILPSRGMGILPMRLGYAETSGGTPPDAAAPAGAFRGIAAGAPQEHSCWRC